MDERIEKVIRKYMKESKAPFAPCFCRECKFWKATDVLRKEGECSEIIDGLNRFGSKLKRSVVKAPHNFYCPFGKKVV